MSGVAKKNAKTAQYNVGVSQVATKQRNESKSLAASSYGAIAKDFYGGDKGGHWCRTPGVGECTCH